MIFVVRIDQSDADARAPARMELASYIKGLLDQLKSKTVLELALLAGLSSTAQGGMRVFLPLYVTDALGFPLAMAGVALTALALSGAVAAIAAGMASDRYRRRRS